MGDLIVLSERRADRSRARGGSAFFFDLANPFSYLAAERVERLLGAVEWVPVFGRGVCVLRAEAERQAHAWRLPLVWPDPLPAAFPLATRAAAFAVSEGRGAEFALAAGRLAFCGGFDLDEPEILADAATAAGLSPAACLDAARDPGWEAAPRATAAGLMRHRLHETPAIRLRSHWRAGPYAVVEAAALVRAAALASSQ
jgi:2-hydroxychromene-2-carboxylate isomerase